ncbi:EAL domain-containing protein [Spirulina subsalsa]|nr:EAL domain-containing protein [Spirulina subsalsa]
MFSLQRIEQAILREEFVPYYQPQVNVLQQKIVGVEALVRWQHPELGLLAPLFFLPFAETTGVISEIDGLVLKKACQDIHELHRLGFGMSVAVNLSASHFNHKYLPRMIAEVLEETGIDPCSLVLELTEGVMIHDVQQAVRVMREVQELGVKIYLDDFGRGYSNLFWLLHFPFNGVKVDRCFIQSSTMDAKNYEVLLSILDLSRRLNLEVILEGVETEQQLQFCGQQGYGVAQGYLFSYPLTIIGLEKRFWLERLQEGLLVA